MKNPETSIEFQAVAAALALRHEPSLKMSKGFLDWANTQDLNVLLDAYDRAEKRERQILAQHEKMHAAVKDAFKNAERCGGFTEMNKALNELYDTCRGIARSVPEHGKYIDALNQASDDEGTPNVRFFHVLVQMAGHRNIQELASRLASPGLPHRSPDPQSTLDTISA